MGQQVSFADPCGDIEAKKANRGAADCRDGDKFSAVKPIMFFTAISPGIEQGDEQAGLGINGRYIAALESIAEGAGQSQVRLLGGTAVFSGAHMIDFVFSQREAFRDAAIFTAT
jgi:hypothetical protein